MSFGESIFFAGFIQKTIKVDLHVLGDLRGHHTEAKAEALPGGAG
jgi:hypothetical protein